MASQAAKSKSLPTTSLTCGTSNAYRQVRSPVADMASRIRPENGCNKKSKQTSLKPFKSINQPMDQSINQPIGQSINQSIDRVWALHVAKMLPVVDHFRHSAVSLPSLPPFPPQRICISQKTPTAPSSCELWQKRNRAMTCRRSINQPNSPK